ncbi:hypothetical protein H633G_09787 [Metarhizium anisopliae BRIP 53284]|nr:hypothetical protein H633G_09787 [Metarhizium anisopliae BRIP 53284]
MREFVSDAANYILREWASPSQVGGDPPVVGPLQKKLHADRQSSEDLRRVTEYFLKLSDICQREVILPDDTWNMDETGFRSGVGEDAACESYWHSVTEYALGSMQVSHRVWPEANQRVDSDRSLSSSGAAGYGYAAHQSGRSVCQGAGRLGPAEVFDAEA